MILRQTPLFTVVWGRAILIKRFLCFLGVDGLESQQRCDYLGLEY